MQNIYLVRHGQSLANVSKTIHATTPDHAIPLSRLGELQATMAGKALRNLIDLDAGTPLRIWTSPYMRARQTAARLREELTKKFPNLDLLDHINLREQEFGLFDGIPDEELATRYPVEHAHYALQEKFEGRFWARMPMGESRCDVATRVHHAFGTFHRDAERHGIKNIIVSCHGVTLRAFVMQWLHLPYEWFEAEPNPGNCDIYHIRKENRAGSGYIYRTPQNIATADDLSEIGQE